MLDEERVVAGGDDVDDRVADRDNIEVLAGVTAKRRLAAACAEAVNKTPCGVNAKPLRLRAHDDRIQAARRRTPAIPPSLFAFAIFYGGMVCIAGVLGNKQVALRGPLGRSRPASSPS